jgi:glycosyltransferase involved in cell wall biosynthesis
MGVRFTFSPKIDFEGMVGGKRKDRLINASKGLIFPVRWHEPFGLAIIESLYYGCPVFATPYGSLPELVHAESGYLSDTKEELIRAIQQAGDYNRQKCHEYARDLFNSRKMAENYIVKYEQILNGRLLNNKAPFLNKAQTGKYLDWR